MIRGVIRRTRKAGYLLFAGQSEFKTKIRIFFEFLRDYGIRRTFTRYIWNDFNESAMAHRYCKGKGLEIGGSASNSFGLNALNVDFTDSMDTVFKKEEIRQCGKALKVDIVANGDNIPLPDASQDFVVSSHVIEHFPNPIKALKEWDRLVRPGGIIFMIVPHKERTFDKGKESPPCSILSMIIKTTPHNRTRIPSAMTTAG